MSLNSRSRSHGFGRTLRAHVAFLLGGNSKLRSSIRSWKTKIRSDVIPKLCQDSLLISVGQTACDWCFVRTIPCLDDLIMLEEHALDEAREGGGCRTLSVAYTHHEG